jgi:hypothetical protein
MKKSTKTKSRPAELWALTGEETFTGDVYAYRTTILRMEANANFLGWIELVNKDGNPVAYIYIRKPLKSPELSFDRDYAVFDWLPEELNNLLAILNSGEPLRVRASEKPAWAFLEHR